MAITSARVQQGQDPTTQALGMVTDALKSFQQSRQFKETAQHERNLLQESRRVSQATASLKFLADIPVTATDPETGEIINSATTPAIAGLWKEALGILYNGDNTRVETVLKGIQARTFTPKEIEAWATSVESLDPSENNYQTQFEKARTQFETQATVGLEAIKQQALALGTTNAAGAAAAAARGPGADRGGAELRSVTEGLIGGEGAPGGGGGGGDGGDGTEGGTQPGDDIEGATAAQRSALRAAGRDQAAASGDEPVTIDARTGLRTTTNTGEIVGANGEVLTAEQAQEVADSTQENNATLDIDPTETDREPISAADAATIKNVLGRSQAYRDASGLGQLQMELKYKDNLEVVETATPSLDLLKTLEFGSTTTLENNIGPTVQDVNAMRQGLRMLANAPPVIPPRAAARETRNQLKPHQRVLRKISNMDPGVRERQYGTSTFEVAEARNLSAERIAERANQSRERQDLTRLGSHAVQFWASMGLKEAEFDYSLAIDMFKVKLGIMAADAAVDPAIQKLLDVSQDAFKGFLDYDGNFIEDLTSENLDQFAKARIIYLPIAALFAQGGWDIFSEAELDKLADMEKGGLVTLIQDVGTWFSGTPVGRGRNPAQIQQLLGATRGIGGNTPQSGPLPAQPAPVVDQAAVNDYLNSASVLR